MVKENKKDLKAKLFGILKVIVTLTLVALILSKVGIERIRETWDNIEHLEVAIAIIISPAVVLLGTYKWRLMVHGSGIAVTWRRALISFLGGMGIGLVTPMRVGELSRIFFLAGKREVLLGIALVDKAIDLESLLLLAIIGCALAFGIIHTAIFGLLSSIVLGFILFPAQYTWVISRIIHYLPYKQKIKGMLASIESLPTKLTMSCLAIRLLICVIDMMQFGLLITAFGSVEPMAILAAYPLVMLVNTFPVTISGIGLREGTAAILLSFFGVPAAVAVSASFMLFCINTLFPGIIGAFFINYASKK